MRSRQVCLLSLLRLWPRARQTHASFPRAERGDAGEGGFWLLRLAATVVAMTLLDKARGLRTWWIFLVFLLGGGPSDVATS